MSTSPPPRFVLHIGAPKTGTSYLQSMLWRNRRGLRRRGVYVPGGGMSDHFRAGFDVREQKRPRTHPSPPWEGLFDELVAEVCRSGAHTGVISAENLVGATPAQVARVFARLEGSVVDVVYGIRPLSRQLTSQWQESVKNFSSRDLPEWLAEARLRDAGDGFWVANDLPAVIERWQPPKGRFHALALPGPNAPVDELWGRFLEVVGTMPRRTVAARRRNESLGYVEASLLVRVQSHLPRKAPRNRIINVLKGILVAQVLAGRPNQVAITLPSTEQAWVDEVTAERCEVLRRDDVELIGDLDELAVLPAGFGPLSLDGKGQDVLAVMRDSLAALLAFEDRQQTTLRWLEASSRMGDTVVGAVDALRVVTDYKTPVIRRRHYATAADRRLATTGASASDPLAALDTGGELIAALLLAQARRSIRIDEIVGPGRGGLLRRAAALVGR